MTIQIENVKPLVNRRLIMPAGARGGEGKTSVCTGIVDYLYHNGLEVNLLDCDAENIGRGGFHNYFPEAQKVDIKSAEGLDEVIERSLQGAPITVADLGAGSGDDTFKWSSQQLQGVRQSGVAITLVGVISNSSSGIEGLLRWATALRDQVDYLLVLNERDGEKFPYLDSAPAKRFIEVAKPAKISFPYQVPGIQAELENLGLSSRSAVEATPEKRGNYLDQAMRLNRIRTNVNKFNAQLDSVRHLLIP